jgi:hypothetical protein
MPNALVGALKNGRAEVEALVKAAPDWTVASSAFDTLFRKMANPQHALWSKALIDTLHATYFEARDTDKECGNITVRTVKAMPAATRNDTKKVLLEIASVCRIFNSAHKVNFEPDELPEEFDAVPMVPSKKKGILTYKNEMPSLYPKTSLTFDYWVPKMLEWTQDIRKERITDWKNGSAMQLDTCTDFMDVCLTFVANPANKVPIAKAEDREAFLGLLGAPFIWKKKSAKREDVNANSAALKSVLTSAAKAAGMSVPIEAWSRLQHAPLIRSLVK